ncbi:hypothetical protein AB2B41_10770 [Marimonas sp. MJW-29]|uniref:Uncharacterized protein n=1 Tax=Sulfitobacter sediminis TaxID=3234186 RepID=A0ABV3RM91_9RHOB
MIARNLTQIDTRRPVFGAVADGYHRYYDPDWEYEKAVEVAESEEERRQRLEEYEEATKNSYAKLIKNG